MKKIVGAIIIGTIIPVVGWGNCYVSGSATATPSVSNCASYQRYRLSGTAEIYYWNCTACNTGYNLRKDASQTVNGSTITCNKCVACSNTGTCAHSYRCGAKSGVCREADEPSSDEQCDSRCNSYRYTCNSGWYELKPLNKVDKATLDCASLDYGVLSDGVTCSATESSGAYSLCKQCPSDTDGGATPTSDTGNNAAITKCYIPRNATFADKTGSGTYSGGNCYYSN